MLLASRGVNVLVRRTSRCNMVDIDCQCFLEVWDDPCEQRDISQAMRRSSGGFILLLMLATIVCLGWVARLFDLYVFLKVP